MGKNGRGALARKTIPPEWLSASSGPSQSQSNPPYSPFIRYNTFVPFVELHARSAFSFLEGSSLPEDLAARCAQFDQPAMAITDAHGVYGSPRFHFAAKKLNIRALIGAEVNAAQPYRFTLLAENRAGYQNLCRLITRTKLRDGKPGKPEYPFATDEEFTSHSAGLICLTGGDEGPLASVYRQGSGPAIERQACQMLERLTRIIGRGNVFVELQRHYRRDQEARNQSLVDLARRLRLPLLATNAVAYATEDRRNLQDVFTCIHHKTTLNEAGTLLNCNSERHLKTSAEMQRLFSDLPDAFANTSELANRMQFTLENLGYEFPRYPVPPGETEMSYLRQLADLGARRRYWPYHEKAQHQIERELAMIEKLKLPGYFLIVWDLIDFCHREKILVQGRGSAANSAVCYALGITAVDPVGMDLLFERFLSEERGEMPDIDLDLPSGNQRERVIQHVYRRYGALGAAMTANVITYRGRSAVRDVGKVLGFSEEQLTSLANRMDHFEWRDPKDTLEKRFTDQGFNLGDPRIHQFYTLTSEVLDLPRHLGQHSGGMVVCQGQLDSVVPLEPATMPNRVVVQWDKDDCADLKLIKIDLLGLGMMAVLEDTIAVIRDDYKAEVDLAHLPEDDPAVYDILQKADTIGLFQVESRAQMSCLPRMKPARFYDIVVQVAIIRPGPIVGQMLHPYLRRRQGMEDPVCLHPSLEPVLARTLGVPLFQEQLIRIAMIAAGFTGGQAEDLRRAMGFKRSEKRMREVEVNLRAGMERNGITGETQDRIVQAISSFALYGFPESHAASFALIAYASAFLKCHYLAAFTVAMLNNQPMGFYSPATLVKDAQRHGQRFRPVDILRSGYPCTVESDGKTKYVRLGFNYVRGLNAVTAQHIEAERRLMPFTSMRDLVRRVPELRKDEMATLAELGALNVLPKEKSDRHRRGALWQSQLALQPVGELLEPATEDGVASPLSPMTDLQRTRADFANSRLTIGKHPMAHYREQARALGALDAATAKAQRDGLVLTVAGSVITRQRPGTAKGFVFLTLEDETGVVNVIVQPALYDRYREACSTAPYLIIKGTLQSITGVISVKAGEIKELHLDQATIMQSHNFH
jgi:error-prone DNA polymerase